MAYSLDQLTWAVGQLLQRAEAAGEIRADIDPEDLLRALVGMCYVYDGTGWQARCCAWSMSSSMDYASGPLRDTIDSHVTLIETRSADVRYPPSPTFDWAGPEVRFGLALHRFAHYVSHLKSEEQIKCGTALLPQ